MSLQLAAQHLASRGRGPDTQLIHMAPQEVAGLQALAKAHGGSLTTNPDTGLPEAGFLSSILPMVIGAGLTAATGGAAAPWMIGLGVGGAQTLATGSLKKGLMAGLGAYGGAGLAGGLMGAGAAGASGTYVGGLEGVGVGGSQGINAMDAMSDIAAQGVGASASTAAAPGYNAMTGGFNGVDPMGLNPVAAQAAPAATPIQAQQAVVSAAPQTVTKMAPTFSDNLSQMGRGLESLGTQEGRTAFMGNAASKGVDATGVGGAKGLMQYGLAGLAPMMSQQTAMAQRPQEYPEYYSFDAGYLGGPSATGNYFAPTLTRLPRRAADGGMMDSENAGIASLAQGGPSHLGDYSDGGRLLRGPGDGVSDSIPASIGGKQPARLADGEFVVSADVVSGLGNGSTEAGARKLYAMMDRVRASRTGTKKMGKTVNPDKLVPV